MFDREFLGYMVAGMVSIGFWEFGRWLMNTLYRQMFNPARVLDKDGSKPPETS